MYVLLYMIIFVSYLVLMYSNPGILKNSNKNLLELVEEKQNLNDYCPICIAKKTPATKHCILCEKCTDGFDHHCYWVNNCIGRKNIQIFIFFVLLVNINIVYNIILTIISKINYKNSS